MSNSFLGRRQFPRRAFERQVGLLFKGQYSILTGGAIGEGGLSVIITDFQIPIGDQVILTFQIPNGRMVAIRAELRNCFPTKIGIGKVHGFKFDNLSFIERRKIRTFVSARTEQDDETSV